MTFSVQNIVASLNKTGVAKSSHFEVQITGLGDSDLERDMMFRCDTAELPGRTITTAEYKIYGPIQKIPYGTLVGDTTLEFLLSEDMREKEYFERWMNTISGTNSFGTSTGTYNMEYYDRITGQVNIRQYGEAGQLSSIHTLIEAYPISIAPIAMSWGDEAAAKLSIVFAYRDYKVVFNRSDQPGLGSSFGFSFGPGGFAAAANIPGLGNISAQGGLGAVGTVNTPFGAIRL
jgi:hypothetical protein